MEESGPSAEWRNPAVRLERQRPYLRLQTVTIFVRDQDASIAFYVGKLDFTLVFDVEVQPGVRWVAVAPPDGTAILGLVVPRRDAGEYALIGQIQNTTFISEDVARTYQLWLDRGVRFRHVPHTPAWGGMFTQFEDPDGNAFALVGFDDMTRELEKQRQMQEERQELERRWAQEIEIAKEVQARLFPQMLPRLETLEYAGVCIQARTIGGDYYDYLALSDGRLGLLIGDVAGKGMPAALLMANLQASLRSQSALAKDAPERVLQAANRLFFENTSASAYATLLLAVYDDATQRLNFANCGHLCGLLLRRDGRVERLCATSTVLGLFHAFTPVLKECRLFAGDLLALYTDGVTEACNRAEGEYGEERLVAALHSHHMLPAEAIAAAIVQEVQQFSEGEQSDDVTLIVAKCRGR